MMLYTDQCPFQIDNLTDKVTVVMAGWTPEEVELYLKQSYNQIDLILPEDFVKVESVLSFKVKVRQFYLFIYCPLQDVKPDIAIKEAPGCDRNESQGTQLISDHGFIGNEMDDFLDDDYSDDDAFSKPKVKKKLKIKTKVKQKRKKKMLQDDSGK